MIDDDMTRLGPPSDLVGSNMAGAIEALNAIVADLFTLYVKTKNFHWHMTGPHFRDYHLLLDEQASQVFAMIDPVAERVRKLGHATLRSVGDIARRQTIDDNDREVVSARDMLVELRGDNLALVRALRHAKALVDDAGDNATSGLIDGWTDEAERRAWFLFEASRAA
jgi:starvation-inducible DNA-binding protein